MSLDRQAAQAAAGLLPLEEDRVEFVSNAPALVATLHQEKVLRERQRCLEKLLETSKQLGVIAELIENIE